MRVLLSFDKFRGSMTATEACEAAREGLAEAHPDWELDLCPLSDGGEGFCEVLVGALNGDAIDCPARDPLGRLLNSSGFGLVTWGSIPEAARQLMGAWGLALEDQDPVAIVEMARASGLLLLQKPDRNPLLTSTLGTGDLLRAASRQGAKAILLGLGGSGTNDMGLGALAALGMKLEGLPERSTPAPRNWDKITGMDCSALEPLPPLFMACDVEHSLLGENGATASFGPQKGLRSEDVARIDAEMGRLAQLLATATGQGLDRVAEAGTGAAGGIAYGLMCAYGVHLLPGSELVSAWLDLPKRVADADLVLTGEGAFDVNSLRGKGPGAVIRLALDADKPVCVYAGAVEGFSPLPSGLSLHAISPADIPRDAAMRMAARLLREAVAGS